MEGVARSTGEVSVGAWMRKARGSGEGTAASA